MWGDPKNVNQVIARHRLFDFPFMQRMCTAYGGHTIELDKLQFWTRLIESLAELKKSPVITDADIKSFIHCHVDYFPFELSCLNEILHVLCEQGMLITSKTDIPTHSFFDRIWNSFRPIKKTLNEPLTVIVPSAVETFCNHMMERIASHHHEYVEGLVIQDDDTAIISIDFIRRFIKEQVISSQRSSVLSTSIQAVFESLLRRGAKEMNVNIGDMNYKALKIQLNDHQYTQHEITQHDIASLLENLVHGNLERQKEKLITAIQACEKKAREFVKNKQSNAALGELKKKKQYAQQIEKIATQLYSLSESSIRRDSAKSIALLTNALSRSCQAASGSINREKVMNTLDQLEDVTDATNEVNQLFESASAGLVNSEELEREFEMLSSELLMEDLPSCPVVPLPSKRVATSQLTESRPAQQPLVQGDILV